MKRKYIAIITLGLAMAVICIVAGYGFSSFRRTSARTPSVSGPAATASLVMPNDEQVRKVTQLQPLLGLLAMPVGKPTHGMPMTLFGERLEAVDSASVDPVVEKPILDHLLSLTLVAGASRFCVIDGIFLAEGDQLSDGTAIRQIKNQQVLISKQDQTKWIYLNDPFDEHAGDQTPMGKRRS